MHLCLLGIIFSTLGFFSINPSIEKLAKEIKQAHESICSDFKKNTIRKYNGFDLGITKNIYEDWKNFCHTGIFTLILHTSQIHEAKKLRVISYFIEQELTKMLEDRTVYNDFIKIILDLHLHKNFSEHSKMITQYSCCIFTMLYVLENNHETAKVLQNANFSETTDVVIHRLVLEPISNAACCSKAKKIICLTTFIAGLLSGSLFLYNQRNEFGRQALLETITA